MNIKNIYMYDKVTRKTYHQRHLSDYRRSRLYRHHMMKKSYLH